MQKTLLASTILALTLAGCTTNNTSPEQTDTAKTPIENAAMTSNPFAQESTLDYKTPDFSKISVADYEPAFSTGMAEHQQEIASIASNPDAPTFANTIEAMETSGQLLNRATTVFFSMSGLISNPEYQRIEAEFAPKLSAHQDDIYLNPELFERIKALHENREDYEGEQQRLIDIYYKEFVRAGADLDDTAKQRLREINNRMATLTTQFSQNLLKAFSDETILVSDKDELKGLSEDDIAGLKAAAEKAGKTGYQITLVNTTRQPILSQLENRALRQKIWETSAERAESNDPLVKELVALRAEEAKLLGFDTWAGYVLDDQMAKTPDAVYRILDDLAPKAVAKARMEADEIQAAIEADGQNFTLEPWDWAYYAEKVRKAKYDFDEAAIKPYFELNNVLENGLFFAMEKLYGITFKERADLPVWQEDVRAFEVFNADGSSVGLFYFDPYAREGKRGGAWMSSYVTQNKLAGDKPVVYNALNIPKPAEGQPTLLTFDEVTTLFHEFGHADHGLFSDVTYPSVAGTATPRDFVEFPSQFNEDWDINPEVMANYAKHYQTGEPIPQALLEKMMAAKDASSGFDTTEYLAAAILDMEYHSIAADEPVTDTAAFEKAALAKHGLDYAPVPPRYKSLYFSHVFAGGYSAGYYAYLWTEVLAADAFAYLQTRGGLNRTNGDDFREAILSIGNSKDLMKAYTEFRGQEPSVDALLVRKGLAE